MKQSFPLRVRLRKRFRDLSLRSFDNRIELLEIVSHRGVIAEYELINEVIFRYGADINVITDNLECLINDDMVASKGGYIRKNDKTTITYRRMICERRNYWIETLTVPILSAIIGSLITVFFTAG